jgi:hypothetical protein
LQDRVPTKKGRALITPENGQPYYAYIVRADEPTQEGTAYNKANLLADATAAALGLANTATPDAAFSAIASRLTTIDGDITVIEGEIGGGESAGLAWFKANILGNVI